MFELACDRARRYTSPYAGLRRRLDGTVFSTVAAFMVVNEEGWCVTAKHLFEEIHRARQSISGVAGTDAAIDKLRRDGAPGPERRDPELLDLERRKAGALSDHVEIWAAGDDWPNRRPRATRVALHEAADLALFKLDPFTPKDDQGYPVLRSDELAPGLAVCRIGFPWHSVEAEFTGRGFDVKSGFPAPLFAVEGIISRFVVEERPDGMKAMYVQTSSPGLRGQSGGPLFDTDGRLCGLQSSTTHLDLGFDAVYRRDGNEIIERQFLNVGQAVHVSEITGFLDARGVSYRTA